MDIPSGAVTFFVSAIQSQTMNKNNNPNDKAAIV
jgi:hypothetical protein